MAAADDTAPIELSHRLGGKAKPDPDAPRVRDRESSSALALAMIEKVNDLVKGQLHAGLPQEAKDALASEAVKLVERAWAARSDGSSSETKVGMRLPEHPPQSRSWMVVAAVLAFLLLLGAIGTVAAFMSLRIDSLDKRYTEARVEATLRKNLVDEKFAEISAQIADDSEYNRVVANWLVGHVEVSNTNASNMDSMLRVIAGKMNADVKGIDAPTKEQLPTYVNKLSAAHEYLDKK